MAQEFQLSSTAQYSRNAQAWHGSACVAESTMDSENSESRPDSFSRRCILGLGRERGILHAARFRQRSERLQFHPKRKHGSEAWLDSRQRLARTCQCHTTESKDCHVWRH